MKRLTAQIRTLIRWTALALLPCLMLTPESALAKPKDGVNEKNPYAIQLIRSGKPIDPDKVRNLAVFRGHRLYVVEEKKGEYTRYMLRLGFFATAAEAVAVQRQVQDAFPGAWVLEVPRRERKRSRRTVLALPARPPAPATQARTAPSREEQGGETYAVQIALSGSPPDAAGLPDLPALRSHTVYVVPLKKGGRTRYQVRVGFFGSTDAAAQVQRDLAKAFPGAWVLRISEAELHEGARTALRLPGSGSQKAARPAPPPAAEPAGTYVLQILLTDVRPDPRSFPNHPALRAHRLYSSSYIKDGKRWYQVRLGFFASAADAARAKQQLAAYYPDAWVTQVSDAERRQALNAASPARKPAQAAPRPDRPPAPPQEKLAEIMEEARVAMAKGDYGRAVALYTKVLGYAENDLSRDAQEFLGLARERKGQIAHAKAEYERYLELYPDGEGASRVRQRLVALVTARKAVPAQSLRKAEHDQEDGVRYDYSGGFSQFYRRDTRTDPQGITTVSLSTLSTDLDLAVRRRSSGWDVRSRLSGAYRYDFTDRDASDTRLTALYVDGTRRTNGLSARLGRQSRSTGGVLGRFDGLLVALPLGGWGLFSAVAGYPVELTTSDQINLDKYFYGASLDMGLFGDLMEMNLFYIEQWVTPDIQDRQAVGGELRLFQKDRSLFTLVDYDILYEKLNTFMFLGSTALGARNRLNVTLNYRASPVLTTSNALQGQTATTLEELQALPATEQQIQQLALDRTATSRSATVGLSHTLSDRLQWNGDVTVSELGGTPDTPGVVFDAVTGTPGTGYEYFVSTQLIASDLIKKGDTTVFGLRYSDASVTRSYMGEVNHRLPLTPNLRVNPRLRLDHRDDLRNGTERWTFRPVLRMDFRVLKKLRLETEGGWEWIREELAAGNEITTGVFFSIGYRANF